MHRKSHRFDQEHRSIDFRETLSSFSSCTTAMRYKGLEISSVFGCNGGGQGGSRFKRTKAFPLRRFVAEADFDSTEELVDAYNRTTGKKERATLRAWLQMYVEWFVDRKETRVASDVVDEYASLARIAVREAEDRRLVICVLSSLVARSEREAPGCRDAIAALTTALNSVDEEVFFDDLEVLFDIASVLLSRIDPSKTVFISQTGRAHEATLLALHQVLLLIQLVAPNQLSPGQNGFYRTVKTRLETIGNQSTHFPITFQVEAAKETLQRLARKEPTSAMLVAKRCIKGFMHLYSVVRHAIVADIRVESLEKGLHELKEACSMRSMKRYWHDALIELSCAARMGQRHPEEWAVFVECLESLMRDQHRVDRREDRKFLAFGIVHQLHRLAASDSPRSIRAKSVDELIRLASMYTVCDGCYRDPEIVEAVLNALLDLCADGFRRGDVEEALRTMVDDGSKQAVIEQWLNGQTLEAKLWHAEARGCPRPSGELFHIIRRMIGAPDKKRGCARKERKSRNSRESLATSAVPRHTLLSPSASLDSKKPALFDEKRDNLDTKPITEKETASRNRTEFSDRVHNASLSQHEDYPIDPSIECIHVGLGCDRGTGLDASAVLCDRRLVHLAVIWRKKVQSLDGSVSYSGANVAGIGGDDERITVLLSEVPPNVHHILFAMCIRSNRVSFTQIRSAYIRMLHGKKKYQNHEMCRFSLTQMSGHAMLMGLLTRRGVYWNFRALGTPCTGRTVVELLQNPRNLQCLSESPSSSPEFRHVRVSVIRGTGLAGKKFFHLLRRKVASTVYFVMKFKQKKMTSECGAKTSKPEWKSPAFTVGWIAESETKPLKIQLFNYSVAGEDDFVGMIEIPGSDLFSLGVGSHTSWHALQHSEKEGHRNQKVSGEILVNVQVEGSSAV